MGIYYSTHAASGNSSPCIDCTVGDRLAAASVRAPAYATNAGSEHSLTAHRLDLNRQSGIFFAAFFGGAGAADFSDGGGTF